MDDGIGGGFITVAGGADEIYQLTHFIVPNPATSQVN